MARMRPRKIADLRSITGFWCIIVICTPRICEVQRPAQALLSAVPVPDPTIARNRIILKGDVPSSMNPPKGCRFHTRCPYAFDRCRIEEPPLRSIERGHVAACHLHDLPAAQNPLAGVASIATA